MLRKCPRVRRPTNDGDATRAYIMRDPGRGTNCIYASAAPSCYIECPDVSKIKRAT